MRRNVKKHKRGSKAANERLSVALSSAVAAASHASLTATNREESVPMFRKEDLPVLSLIAMSAAQSTTSSTAPIVLECLLTPLKPCKTPPPPPLSVLASSTATSSTGIEEGAVAEEVATRYPEVRVLYCLHYVRRALRNLQSCPPEARRLHFSALAEHMMGLATVLPDPLFLALTAVLNSLLASADEEVLSPHKCHVLEVQLLQVVEATQLEVLRSTKKLTVRAGELTLRFHHDIPLV